MTDVVFDGLVSHHAQECINFDNNYHGARGGNFPTLFKNYTLSNVRCTRVTGTGISVDGLPQMPIQDLLAMGSFEVIFMGPFTGIPLVTLHTNKQGGMIMTLPPVATPGCHAGQRPD